MNAVTIYKPDTGEIVFSATGDIGMFNVDAYIGLPYLEQFGDSQFQYVVNGNLVNKQENPAVLTGNVLTNIPSGTVLEYLGAETPIVGTQYEVVLSIPELRDFRLKCFPYKDTTYTVAA